MALDLIHPRNLRSYLFTAFTVFVVANIIVFALFGTRPFDFDETGIFNAPYMVAEYDQMSYPVWVHRHPDNWFSIWFHPPIYYAILGVILKFLKLYYMEAVVPTILFLLFAYFIFTLPATLAEKYAYLVSALALVVLCVTTQMGHFGTRPDMSASLAWGGGLIALEKGRRQDWRKMPIAVGSFLVVLGATFHYITAFFSLSVLVYALFAIRDLRRPQIWPVIGAGALGAALTGIPYLVFFIIPSFDNIYTWLTTASQSNLHGGNPIEIFKFKLDKHSLWNLYWSKVPLFRYFPGYLQSMRVPIGLAAVVVLVAVRETRVIGLAAMPQVLFIYFVADKTQPFYLIPEYLLTFLAASVCLFKSISWILRRIRYSSLERPFQFAAAIFCAAYLVFAAPRFQFAYANFGTYQYHWQDVERAAAQTIVGPDAVIGDYIATWYINGGRYWYPEGHGRLLKKINDPEAYFRNVTAVVEYGMRMHEINFANHVTKGGKEVAGVYAGLYARRMLKLKGFLYGAGGGIVYYALDAPKKFIHYRLVPNENRLERFDESEGGEVVVGVYQCLRPEDRPARRYFDYVHNSATLLAINDVNPQYLGYFRTSAQRLRNMERDLDAGCSITERHYGTVTQYTNAEFMKMVPQFHTTVSFFKNLDDAALAARKAAGAH